MPIFKEHPDLLVSFRRGDRAALERVYGAYIDTVEKVLHKGLCRVARGPRAAAGTQDLADLAQEVFSRAFSARARLSYDGIREYGPYLATTARNLLIDWLRLRGREITLTDLDQYAAAAESEETAWASPAVSEVVAAYLAQLPAELREVHEHRYVRGQFQQQVVAALGISRQQLRTREKHLCDGLAAALKKAGLLVK